MAEVNNQSIRMAIGLGNPDKEYQNTYHNVGHLAMDFLSENPLAGVKFLKSDAYMNRSGPFVGRALKKSGVKPAELLVIHDDADIKLGDFKLSFGRGSAGHNGIESVIESLGTNNFWRLRMGIRKPANGNKKETRKKASELVLKKIGKEDLKILQQALKKAENELRLKLNIC